MHSMNSDECGQSQFLKSCFGLITLDLTIGEQLMQMPTFSQFFITLAEKNAIHKLFYQTKPK